MDLKIIEKTEIQGDIIRIEYVPMSILVNLAEILFKGNPKKHDLELITACIARDGFIDPPKWDSKLNGGEGGIVYGNGRVEALVQLLEKRRSQGLNPPRGIGMLPDGEWCIPIKFGVDAESEVAAKRLAIDHNNLTLAGDFLPSEQAQMYDERLYASILQELKDASELPLTVDSEYLEELLQSVDNSTGRGSENEQELLPEHNITPRCRLGEIWALGRHRLLCGDSCDEEQVMRLLDGKTPDLIWSDPPYGIKCQKKDGRIGSEDDNRKHGKGYAAKPYPIIANDESPEVAIASFHLCQKLFPSAVQIWWGANHYSEGLPNSSCWIVWDKLNGDTDFADCELAWTNQKTAVRKFAWMWNGLIKQGEAANQKRIHPNQKPVELVTFFWDKYGDDAALCFDPFLGSGTSIMAAQKHPTRTVYGCELMPEYCEIIMQRYETAAGEKVVKL